MGIELDSPRWKIVWFRSRKRQEPKLVRDPKKGALAVKRLNELEGVKAHLVCRRFPKFSPKGEPEDDEQLWCPYCRRWRWFSVPRHRTPFTDLEIKCCGWCQISEDDAFVRNYNHTWEGRRPRKRKKKRRRR